MHTKLHWIATASQGKLAISARPRGGDWLEDELEAWKRAGATEVLSLLTLSEEQSLDLVDEEQVCRASGLRFRKLAIEDRDIPRSEPDVMRMIDTISRDLALGEGVVVHCRQGVGRAGMITAAVLMQLGRDPKTAIKQVSLARGIEVPETPAQRAWIQGFARNFHPATAT